MMTTRSTTIDEVRGLAAVPIWSDSRPNAAGFLGISRSHAYKMAEARVIPTVALGTRLVVPTSKLLALLDVDLEAVAH